MTTVRLSVLFLLLGHPPPFLLQARNEPPLKLLTTLLLPDIQGRIDHLAADVKGGRLFLAATANNTVEVIDVSSVRQIQTISGLAQPQSLAYVAATGELLVANAADGSLRAYDGSSLRLLRSTSLGGDADSIRLEPRSQQVFVGYGVGGLAVLDSRTALAGEIEVGAHPVSFELESAGPRIFVNLPGLQEIVVVDRNTKAAIASWPVLQARENSLMALDEAHKRLFVVCRRPPRLLVLNVDTGKLITSLPTVGDANDISYDRARSLIYVSGGAGSGAVVVYRQKGADHYREMCRIPTVPEGRTGLFVPEWNRLFVAARNHGGSPAQIEIFAVNP